MRRTEWAGKLLRNSRMVAIMREQGGNLARWSKVCQIENVAFSVSYRVRVSMAKI